MARQVGSARSCLDGTRAAWPTHRSAINGMATAARPHARGKGDTHRAGKSAEVQQISMDIASNAGSADMTAAQRCRSGTQNGSVRQSSRAQGQWLAPASLGQA